MNKKFYQLAPDFTICRIINGMWQVAGGHGHVDHESAIGDLVLLLGTWQTSMARQRILLVNSGLLGNARNNAKQTAYTKFRKRDIAKQYKVPELLPESHT
jgi:hypothetical protein